MSDEKKKCSRCPTLHSSINKNGLLFKTCDGCREKGRKRDVERAPGRLDERKKYYLEHAESHKVQRKQFYELNKERLNKTHREWSSKNKESQYQKHKANRQAGKHNCTHDIRKDTCKVCSPNSYLKKIVSKRIWEALQSNKSKGSLAYLGCDIPTFREHLEKSFSSGMDWSNQGKDGWDIDHIIPVLYAQDGVEPSLEEVGKRLHYTNCQAMWHTENMKKGNRYVGDYQSDSDSDSDSS
jgi:hypothetical protein